MLREELNSKIERNSNFPELKLIYGEENFSLSAFYSNLLQIVTFLSIQNLSMAIIWSFMRSQTLTRKLAQNKKCNLQREKLNFIVDKSQNVFLPAKSASFREAL